MGRNTYYEALAGAHCPAPATLARLRAALERAGRPAHGNEALRDRAAWRAALAIASERLGLAAAAVMASDPARKATADQVWMQAARARQLAYWLANGMLGLTTSEIGRLAGVTKQAVSVGIRKTEDSTDPQIVAARARLEEVFSG